MAKAKMNAAEKLNNFKANLEGSIADIIKSEASASKLLAVVTRDLLAYVPETGDIGMANRLINGLSKANRLHTVTFFKALLEWDMNDAGTHFTTKMTGKRRALSIQEARVKFLADDKATLWTWEKAKRVTVARTADQLKATAAARIKNDIEKGIKEHKLSPLDILHIIGEAGVTIGEIVKLADVMKAEAEAKVAPVAEPKAKAPAKAKRVAEPKAKAPAKAKRVAEPVEVQHVPNH
jgi:hypothetical protein